MNWRQQILHSRPIRYALAVAAICIAARIFFMIPTVSPDFLKRRQTETNATGLVQAIEGFYSAYHHFPEISSDVDQLQTEGQPGGKLLTILLGKEEVTDSMQNKSQIRFLTVEETKNKNKGGLFYQNGGTGPLPVGLYDAWGRPFYVRFDTAYKGELPDPLRPGSVIRDKSIIVYSYGKDGKPGGGDDIKSW